MGFDQTSMGRRGAVACGQLLCLSKNHRAALCEETRRADAQLDRAHTTQQCQSIERHQSMQLQAWPAKQTRLPCCKALRDVQCPYRKSVDAVMFRLIYDGCERGFPMHFTSPMQISPAFILYTCQTKFCLTSINSRVTPDQDNFNWKVCRQTAICLMGSHGNGAANSIKGYIFDASYR